MKYTVIWPLDVLDTLASIWLKARDRAAVSRASHQIDQLLRHQPLAVGGELGSHRRLEVSPLEVVYTVSPDDCMVRVLRISYVP